MTDMHDRDDDALDERARSLAAHYHRPQGSVPRDEMWSAIAPAWRAARATATVQRRPVRAAPWIWSGLVAAGVLVGVALDRELGSRQAPIPAVTVARGPSQVVTAPETTAVAGTPGTPGASPASPSSEAASGAASPRATSAAPSTFATAGVHGGSGAERGPAAAPPSSESVRDVQNLYHAAAVQTLVQAEALLTTYRRSDDPRRDAASLQQAGRWARDVLSSTRLLLDSPAANDAQLRALLGDLELVLAQIVQLSGNPLQADERELIERAMHDRNLLPRLRSALPAGAAAS